MPRQTQSTKSRWKGRPQSVHFGRFDGIKSNTARADIKPTELAAAMNLDIDRDGRLSVCPGVTHKLAGDYHSVHSTDTICLAVKSGVLVSINADFSLGSTILASIGDDPMSYATVNGVIYLMNGYASGYVEDGVYHFFPAPTENYKRRPPAGTLVVLFNDRLYFSEGKTLWISDPSQYSRVDWRTGFKQFPSDITMVAPDDDGMYVSTTEKIYFLNGASPDAMTWTVVQDAPVIPGAWTYVDSKLWGVRKEDYLYGKIVAMYTEAGLCWGTNNGVFGNVSGRKYIGPSGVRGSMAFIRGNINQVLCSAF